MGAEPSGANDPGDAAGASPPGESPLTPLGEPPPRVRRAGEVDLGPLPRRLGRYEVLERIGAGGMGTVFRARQIPMDRIVALKVLAPDLASDRRYLRRFVREARAAGSLDHPNIVRVHDVGSAEGHPYICMEHVDGPSVERLLRERTRLDPAEAVRIALQIARALEYAHRAGIIHCDIKPDNVLVDRRGTAKLADLGLARRPASALGDGSSRYAVGMGTPHYVAIEQARDASRADERSDIYSLGATLYHMLTGRVPFDGDSTVDILMHAAQDPLVSPRALVPDLPESLSAVVERMMAKSPQDRYRDASEVLHDLREVERELAGLGPPALLAHSAPSREAHGPEGVLFAIAAALAAIVLAGLLALALRPREESEVPAGVLQRTASAGGGTVRASASKGSDLVPGQPAAGATREGSSADRALADEHAAPVPGETSPKDVGAVAERQAAPEGGRPSRSSSEEGADTAPGRALEEVLRQSRWFARAGRYGEAERCLRTFAASAPKQERAKAVDALAALHDRAERESGETLELARELAAAGRLDRAASLLSWALSSWGLPVLEARAEEGLRAVDIERRRLSEREHAVARAEAAARALADSAEALARRRRFAEASQRLEAALSALERSESLLAGELRRRLAALEALDAAHAAIRARLSSGEGIRPRASEVFTGWGSPDAVLVGADEDRVYVELASGKPLSPARAARRWEDLSPEEYARLAELCVSKARFPGGSAWRTSRPRQAEPGGLSETLPLEVLGAGLAWLEAGRPEEAVRLWKAAAPTREAEGRTQRKSDLEDAGASFADLAAGYLRRPAETTRLGAALRRARAFDEASKPSEALRELEAALAIADGDSPPPAELARLLGSLARDMERSCGLNAVAFAGPGESEELLYDFALEASRRDWRQSGSRLRQGEQGVVSPSGGSCVLEFEGSFVAGGEIEVTFRFLEDVLSRVEIALVPDEPEATSSAIAALSVEDLPEPPERTPGEAGLRSNGGALAKRTLRMVAFRGWRELPWSVFSAGGEAIARGVRAAQAPRGPERPVLVLAGWIELRSVRLRGRFDPEWLAALRREREARAAAALERSRSIAEPQGRARELERVRWEYADCRRLGLEAMRLIAEAQIQAGRRDSAARTFELRARFYPEFPEEARRRGPGEVGERRGD